MILLIYFINSLGKHTINNNSRVVVEIIFLVFNVNEVFTYYTAKYILPILYKFV